MTKRTKKSPAVLAPISLARATGGFAYEDNATLSLKGIGDLPNAKQVLQMNKADLTEQLS